MNQVPVRGHPLFTGVLAHGREKNAIPKGNTPQLDLREQSVHNNLHVDFKKNELVGR
jgi:hypothetical protein